MERLGEETGLQRRLSLVLDMFSLRCNCIIKTQHLHSNGVQGLGKKFRLEIYIWDPSMFR